MGRHAESHRAANRLVVRAIALALLAISLEATAFAESDATLQNLSAETSAIEHWQLQRAQQLKSDSGWLTLVGLFWLEEGESTLGRDPKNTIRVDHPGLAPVAGSFIRKGPSVRFVARSRGTLTHLGKPATALDLVADTQGEPTLLESGPLSFILIERAGQYGIRVRDRQSAARLNFKGLDYFPVSTDWAFDARFEPYEPPRSIRIINILGMEVPMDCPGAVVFMREGKEYRLDVVLEEPGASELFLMFADQTSGRETYGAGRFMYLDMPRNGQVRLDFNKAYSPPCAFSNFATCPLPPPQNRLPLRIEAGEKKYGAEPVGTQHD